MIDLLQQPVVALACVLQVIIAVFVLTLLDDVRGLLPCFRGQVLWRRVMGLALRFIIRMGWVGIMAGALFSAASITMAMMGYYEPDEAITKNAFGILISRLSGVIMLAHVAWLALRLGIHQERDLHLKPKETSHG